MGDTHPMNRGSLNIRNGAVLAWLEVTLVLLAMAQPHTSNSIPAPGDYLRLTKRSLDSSPEYLYEDDYSPPPVLQQQHGVKRNVLRLSKRNVLRLSKKGLLRLSKKDLLRLSKKSDMLRISKKDLLRLSKREDEDSNADLRLTKRLPSSLRLSKRPSWSEVEWEPQLLDKKDKSEAPMIIRLSKRDMDNLLEMRPPTQLQEDDEDRLATDEEVQGLHYIDSPGIGEMLQDTSYNPQSLELME